MKPPVFNHKQYTDLEADYMILKAENEKLKAQLSTTNKRLEAAVDDIWNASANAPCAVCANGFANTGAPCTVYPCKFEWRGQEAGKRDAPNE